MRLGLLFLSLYSVPSSTTSDDTTIPYTHPISALPYLSLHQPSLLGCFTFDGSLDNLATSTYNDSPTAPPATLHTEDGSTTPIYNNDAINDKAIYFDGQTYLSVPLDVNHINSPKLTMGAWVKAGAFRTSDADSSSDYNPAASILTIDNGNNGRGLNLKHNVGFVAKTGSSGFGDSTPIAFKPDTWQFVAVIYNQQDSTVTLYVDGESVTSTSKITQGGRPNLRIGGNSAVGTNFRGSLDSAFVYSKALTTNELDYLRLAGPTPMDNVAGSAGYSVSLDGGRHVEVEGTDALR